MSRGIANEVEVNAEGKVQVHRVVRQGKAWYGMVWYLAYRTPSYRASRIRIVRRLKRQTALPNFTLLAPDEQQRPAQEP